MRRLALVLLGMFTMHGSFALNAYISQQQPAICTYATGYLLAVGTGGTPPYTYLWNTGHTGNQLAEVVAGTYSVTVTDANSDEATAEVPHVGLPDQGGYFGEVPQTSYPQWLLPGEYEMVTRPLYMEPYAWLENYFVSVGIDGCPDTSNTFIVPELPAPCATLKGTAYMDDDQNCIRGVEPRVSQAVMTLEPGGYTVLTSSSGYYQMNVPTGSYTLEQGPGNLDEHCVGGPIPIDLPDHGMTVTQDVADTSLLARDVALRMASGPARPGFVYSAGIGIDHNTAGGTGTISLSCTFDPVLTYISASPTPDRERQHAHLVDVAAYLLRLPERQHAIPSAGGCWPHRHRSPSAPRSVSYNPNRT